MIPKMMKKSSATTMTLKIFGIAMKRAWMPIFRPLFLLMTRIGLTTLSSLKTLKILSLPFSIESEMIERITTMKSMRFHPFLRKESFPLKSMPVLMILEIHSKVKTDVKKMSDFTRKEKRELFGSRSGFSKARRTLWVRIRVKMNFSK